ncbi:MAG: hypothetical protein MK289_19845 [Trichodesmium sp. ALOHA_ZT_67]|nr:hypothetical protein [Trichodesmium sp. ALOHA_ZT_67]MDT9338885.1 hypothetical protein [Trichodesmium erythraeum 21-75]
MSTITFTEKNSGCLTFSWTKLHALQTLPTPGGDLGQVTQPLWICFFVS